jgi:thiopeptide-type bacteriocin biosynthesis protein
LSDAVREARRQRRARWLQVNCALFSQGPGRPPYAPWGELGEAVEGWRAEGRFERAFFMQKPPGLRLRFSGDDLGLRLEPALIAWLEAAERRDVIRGFRFADYEPEVFRFGGPVGMDIAHDHFDGDSRVVMRYAALSQPDRGPVPADLFSIAVTSDLLARCVEDRAEAWDVWQRLARAAGGAPPVAGDDSVAEAVRDAMLLTPTFVGGLTPAVAALMEDARAANAHVAGRLRAAQAMGRLRVGVRAWLATVCIFHWSRLGLTTAEVVPMVAYMSRLLLPEEARS